MRLRALLATLAVVALAALALGRGPGGRPSPRPAGGPRVATPAPAPEPPLPPVEPGAIRDIFRFADDPVLAPALAEPPGGPEGEKAAAALPPPGLRLVGLLRRSGRLVAALAADGEVEVAGPGERAAGVTVVSIGEDHVRVRRADGSEETLVLP